MAGGTKLGGGVGDTLGVYPMAMRWDDAEQLCVEMGGHLASLRSPSDYAALQVRKTPCRPRSWANFSLL